jgi:hypothetical protein
VLPARGAGTRHAYKNKNKNTMLKPIPQENAENPVVPKRKKSKILKSAPSPSLQNISQTNRDKDQEVIRKVSVKFFHFVKNNIQHSAEEVSEIIHGLQRSVLSLERQRMRLMVEKNKKKRKK